MTKAEFEKLVTEYGELAFECGLQRSPEEYAPLRAKAATAKQAVLDAFDNKESK